VKTAVLVLTSCRYGRSDNPVVSKTRKAARDRAFSRKEGSGRPRGALPLRKNARRFETAMFHMLIQTRCRGEPTHAAEFAASVLHDSVVVSIDNSRITFDFTGGFGEKVVRMTAEGATVRYDSTERGNARTNRRDKILREGPGLIAGATGHDRVWLEVSARLLHALFNAVAIGDADAIRQCLTLLQRQGWSEPLRRLFSAEVVSES
jgi:hypothetical protein